MFLECCLFYCGRKFLTAMFVSLMRFASVAGLRERLSVLRFYFLPIQ